MSKGLAGTPAMALPYRMPVLVVLAGGAASLDGEGGLRLVAVDQNGKVKSAQRLLNSQLPPRSSSASCSLPINPLTCAQRLSGAV